MSARVAVERQLVRPGKSASVVMCSECGHFCADLMRWCCYCRKWSSGCTVCARRFTLEAK